MIYDGFMFFDELDLLEIRLHELDGFVDKFIVVEADTTFSGNPKPLIFQENSRLFTQFESKIIHIVVRNMPTTKNPWDREIHQRNCVMMGIPDSASGEDLLIACDVDEIPRVSALRSAMPITKTMCLEMSSYGVFLNAYSGRWKHAKIGPITDFRRMSPNEVRHAGHPPIENAGWHFSSIGTPEQISKKMTAFSHQEESVQKYNNVEKIRQNIAQGRGLFGGLMQFHPLDSTFPAHVVQNAERFKGMIWRPV